MPGDVGTERLLRRSCKEVLSPNEAVVRRRRRRSMGGEGNC